MLTPQCKHSRTGSPEGVESGRGDMQDCSRCRSSWLTQAYIYSYTHSHTWELLHWVTELLHWTSWGLDALIKGDLIVTVEGTQADSFIRPLFFSIKSETALLNSCIVSSKRHLYGALHKGTKIIAVKLKREQHFHSFLLTVIEDCSNPGLLNQALSLVFHVLLLN